MIKILVLDDEIGTCSQLKDFLEYRGYKVFTATKGERALRILEKEEPQILLLDIKMPGVNGIDVLREAKKTYSRVRVIMITALKTEEKKSEVMDLGADEYLVKPFNFDIVENIIIRMVNEIILEEGAA